MALQGPHLPPVQGQHGCQLGSWPQIGPLEKPCHCQLPPAITGLSTSAPRETSAAIQLDTGTVPHCADKMFAEYATLGLAVGTPLYAAPYPTLWKYICARRDLYSEFVGNYRNHSSTQPVIIMIIDIFKQTV